MYIVIATYHGTEDPAKMVLGGTDEEPNTEIYSWDRDKATAETMADTARAHHYNSDWIIDIVYNPLLSEPLTKQTMKPGQEPGRVMPEGYDPFQRKTQ